MEFTEGKQNADPVTEKFYSRKLVVFK